MSLVLRHQPDVLSLTPDDQGWVSTQQLLTGLKTKFRSINVETIKMVVESNDKQRFCFNHDFSLIRANQGHSISIDLGLEPTIPPRELYHGTYSQALKDIFKNGLLKMTRQHVHLSSNIETAIKVGSRRGKPIVLKVCSQSMHNDGHIFYLSDNNVWLTEHVPAEYLSQSEDKIQKL